MRSLKRKARGRPRGRVAPHRPVLTARVTEELHTQIFDSARKHGRTASEEVMWLAEQGIAWEAARPEIEAWMAEIRRQTSVKRPIREALKQLGLGLTKVPVAEATVPGQSKLTVTNPDLARERMA